MNIILNLGNFMIKYNKEISVAAFILAAVLVVFVVIKIIKAFHNRTVMLSELHNTVKEINTYVDRLTGKEEKVIYVDSRINEKEKRNECGAPIIVNINERPAEIYRHPDSHAYTQSSAKTSEDKKDRQDAVKENTAQRTQYGGTVSCGQPHGYEINYESGDSAVPECRSDCKDKSENEVKPEIAAEYSKKYEDNAEYEAEDDYMQKYNAGSVLLHKDGVESENDYNVQRDDGNDYGEQHTDSNDCDTQLIDSGGCDEHNESTEEQTEAADTDASDQARDAIVSEEELSGIEEVLLPEDVVPDIIYKEKNHPKHSRNAEESLGMMPGYVMKKQEEKTKRTPENRYYTSKNGRSYTAQGLMEQIR